MTELEPTVRLEIESAGSVIRLSGQIDLATASTLAAAFARCDGPVVAVDLRDVSFMDVVGAHALVDAAEALRDDGCMIIHAPQPPVTKVIEVLRLTERFKNLHMLDGEGSGGPHSA